MIDHDLADLSAFAAVARARGFRRAAAETGGSPSGLSEAIRRLEARLGVRLLNRTTRSVTPTEAGRRLLERLSPALAEVGAALESLDDFRGAARGTLRLNVPSVAADLVLPEILTDFIAAHPAIVVEVAADERFVDVLAAGFDAGVRYDDAVEKDMIAVPIGPREQRFVTAASVRYLARHGTPAHPRDLMDHRCIRQRFLSGAMPPWEFEKAGERVRISPAGPLSTNRVGLQVAAARAGLGVVHSFEGFLAPALAAGDLVPILEDWSERFTGPFLYYPSRRLMPGPLRAFVDHIRAAGR